MKKHLFSLALILSLVISGSLLAVGSHKTNSRILVPLASHHFGDLTAGQVVQHDFTIKNTGKTDLVIHQVAVSCICNKTTLGSTLIKPGGKTILHVELDTSNKPLGEYIGTLSVFSNDPGRLVTEIKIKANITKGPSATLDPTASLPPTTGWKTITPRQAHAMLQSKPAPFLVDVRRLDEYQSGHIPGSILIPLDRLADEAKLKLPDQKAAILVYCRSGVRSKKAAQTLVELGYSQVYDLGGILDWPYEVEK